MREARHTPPRLTRQRRNTLHGRRVAWLPAQLCSLAAAAQRHALRLGRRRFLPLLAVTRDFVLHQQLHLRQHHALCRLARLRVRLEVCPGASAGLRRRTFAHARSHLAREGASPHPPRPQARACPCRGAPYGVRSAGGDCATATSAAPSAAKVAPSCARCVRSCHNADACAGPAGRRQRGMPGDDDVG